MPSFEGIEVAIVTQPNSQKLPEFPLSDPSSKNTPPSIDGLLNPGHTGSTSLRAGLRQAQKDSPRISVYIPSDPGSRFGIHYALTSEPSRYLYFKIFMNGKNIANCGVKALNHPSGSITRSLCEPSARWKYKEDGVLLIRDGIEARCFSFLPTASQSVAEDGGFIEAQVFRAKGRYRRMPVLEGHRGQESYGIGSPSGGLLDWPEEACFYDWILVDSKDSPFISFRFHYRSLSNLRQLSLAPDPTELDAVSVHMKKDAVARQSGVSHSILSSSDENIEGLPAVCPHSAPSSPVSEKSSLSQLEPCFSTRPARLAETAPGGFSPNLSARPLPEIPVKQPVNEGDVEPQVLAHVYSTLSNIQEEIEDSETSMTTTFPVRSDSLRGPEAQVLDSNGCEVARSQSLLQKKKDSTVLGSLAIYSEQSQMAQSRAVSATKGVVNCGKQTQSANTSGITCTIVETEVSFRTGVETE